MKSFGQGGLRGSANLSVNRPDSQTALSAQPSHPLHMLTELYIEALLVDEELAVWVWEAWPGG
jgi:hypothetical protein